MILHELLRRFLRQVALPGKLDEPAVTFMKQGGLLVSSKVHGDLVKIEQTGAAGRLIFVVAAPWESRFGGPLITSR
jgi:hypothetical protein